MSPRSQRLSEHLTTGEVACRCGCGYGLAAAQWPEIVPVHFEAVRALVGRPLWVTSGARCDQHNADEGGVENSAHTRLLALDLAASGGLDRIQLITAHLIATAVVAGELSASEGAELYAMILATVRGLGVARGFIHNDHDHVKPRPAAWSY